MPLATPSATQVRAFCPRGGYNCSSVSSPHSCLVHQHISSPKCNSRAAMDTGAMRHLLRDDCTRLGLPTHSSPVRAQQFLSRFSSAKREGQKRKISCFCTALNESRCGPLWYRLEDQKWPGLAQAWANNGLPPKYSLLAILFYNPTALKVAVSTPV